MPSSSYEDYRKDEVQLLASPSTTLLSEFIQSGPRFAKHIDGICQEGQLVAFLNRILKQAEW